MSRGLAPKRPSYRLSHSGSAPIRIPEASNDNIAAGRPALGEPELRAALDHFARHHLNAAHDAHARARAAVASGNEADFLFWAQICGALDRRLARTLSNPREVPG